MEKKFIIIGDIHGRTNWKTLIDPLYATNIFVGDYFDPYDSEIDFDMMSENFNTIIELKKKYPDNFILLYGNHDLHYMKECQERYSRYQAYCAREISELLKDNEQYFHGVAYTIGDKYIVTHAGITNTWATKYVVDINLELQQMENKINNLWKHYKTAFMFEPNGGPWDVYGDDYSQSPLWIRPYSLAQDNLYKGTDVIQIVGHTQTKNITDEDSGIIMVDCLGTVSKSLEISIDLETKEEKNA